MRIEAYSVEADKRAKAKERGDDLEAAQQGRAAERQARNRFIPNPKDWIIETTPKPLKGEVLD